MNWKLLLAGILLLLVQTTPALPVPGIVVELGRWADKTTWYENSNGHAHDKQVELRPTYHPDGSIEVTVRNAEQAGTDLTFLFSHDAAGQTTALATALFRADVSAGGKQKTWHLSDLEGRVLVPGNEWGPGRSLNALFSIRGHNGKHSELLMGSFSLLPPKQG